MKISEVSFKGRITTRMLDPVSGNIVIKNFRTKKQDDILLLKLAKETLPSECFDGTRKHVTKEQTKDLDILFEKKLKQKLPNKNYDRSVISTTNSFLYLIVHPDSYLPDNNQALIKGGICIDFFA